MTNFSDLIEAAKWIQREIRKFGGNPNDVTILGLSSSAQMVSLLTMTEKTVDLFHRAIIMSGSGTVWNALWNDVTDYRTLANYFNCSWSNNVLDSRQILDCIRKIDPFLLVNKFNELRKLDYDGNDLLHTNFTSIKTRL